VLSNFTALGLDTVEIECGLSVDADADAGAVTAKTGVTGHFEVTLSWTRREDQAGVGDRLGPTRTRSLCPLLLTSLPPSHTRANMRKRSQQGAAKYEETQPWPSPTRRLASFRVSSRSVVMIKAVTSGYYRVSRDLTNSTRFVSAT
jgi:hypothetical protein